MQVFQEDYSKSSTIYSGTQCTSQNPIKYFVSEEWSADDFQIGRPLGKGRFGRVYLAREKKCKFICVLKTISMNLIESSTQIQLIAREVEINANLNHENILKMYGYFADSHRFYFILEFATQGDLYSLMLKQPKQYFPEHVASNYIKQVVKALIYLKHKKIIHRDIKPENILVQEGILKLSDFGWAIHNPENKARKTHCGTLDYVPPEMLVKEMTGRQNEYDFGVDLWSVGVLAYELSCGYAPFQNRTVQKTQEKIFNLVFDFPSHCSEHLKDFVRKILKKVTSERLPLEQMLEHPWIFKYSSSFGTH